MNLGCVLGGKYEIVDILGSGGMGKVYLARNISLGTLWAIKELCKAPEALSNIKAEVNILKNLDHPSLPKVFDVIETKDSYFIIFTYINGISLSKRLSEAGRFDERTVIAWGIDLCDVLSYLHNLKPKPVIYRDLKPSNIMLTNEGGIKLVDFGIAREYKAENNEDTVFIGTRGYAAPEQYGLGQSGPYTDIYSLGVTLRQLLTGVSPMSASWGEMIYGNVSKELINIIEKCTNQDIDKRYSSAADVKEELSNLLLMQNGNINSKSSKKTVYKIEKKAFFKQRIISLDNARFASELAVAASCAGLTVLLIDIHRFAPVCDFYLGIEKQHKEFTIMKEPEGKGPGDTVEYMRYIKEYFYPVPGVEGLSYLSLDLSFLNERSISELSGKAGGFDLVLFSISINLICADTKALFECADKIIVADELSIDSINYWNRTFLCIKREFDIDKAKAYFIGWLYDKNKPYILRDITSLLNGLEFIGTVSECSKRYFNTNFSKGAAILNYRNAKKEYGRILFNIRLSPVEYTESTLSSILNLAHIGRKKFEQETYN